jgi:hypothetical protein
MPTAPVAKRTPSRGAIKGIVFGARGEGVEVCGILVSLDRIYLVNHKINNL